MEVGPQRTRDVNMRRCLDAVKTKFQVFARFDYRFLRWMLTRFLDPVTRWALFQAAFAKPTAKVRYLKGLEPENNWKLYGLFGLACPSRRVNARQFDQAMESFLRLNDTPAKLTFYEKGCGLVDFPKDVRSPWFKVDYETGQIAVVGKYEGLGYVVRGETDGEIFRNVLVEFLEAEHPLPPAKEAYYFDLLGGLVGYTKKFLHVALGMIACGKYREHASYHQLYDLLRKKHRKALIVFGIYKHVVEVCKEEEKWLSALEWVFERGEDPATLLLAVSPDARIPISEVVDFDRVDDVSLSSILQMTHGNHILDIYLRRGFSLEKIQRVLSKLSWQAHQMTEAHEVFQILRKHKISTDGMFERLNFSENYKLHELRMLLEFVRFAKRRIAWFELVVLIKSGFLDIVKQAVEIGADFSPECAYVARTYGEGDILEWLLQNGCPPEKPATLSGIGAL